MTDPQMFFASLANDPQVEWLDEEQLRAIADVRAVLARVTPRYVIPRETKASISDYVELELIIPHASDPDVRIELSFGDGLLALLWPGGRHYGGWDWQPELATIVESLLAGRNRQTVYRARDRVIAVDTEVYDEVGNRTRFRRRFGLAGAFLHPFAVSRERTLSFDRERPFIEQ